MTAGVPEEHIEAAAEAIAAADNCTPDVWDELSGYAQESYRRMAVAALASLELEVETDSSYDFGKYSRLVSGWVRVEGEQP